jgi:hypothetical protein
LIDIDHIMLRARTMKWFTVGPILSRSPVKDWHRAGYQRPRPTIPHPGHRIWLTLTRDKHPSRVLIFMLS